MKYLYLHGFASGARSRKAQFFIEQFSQIGIDLLTPDLNLGNFTTVTLSRQLAYLQSHYGNAPVSVMGSSLGGLLAVLWAIGNPLVEKLVLLAPAFQFGSSLRASLGVAEMQSWQQQGWRNFYHYDLDQNLPLEYAFVEDAESAWCSEENLQRELPIVIIHGKSDSVVLPQLSQEFASRRSFVDLFLVESDHSLGSAIDYIWQKTQASWEIGR